jgi:Stress responsive A/B Barrel Domain
MRILTARQNGFTHSFVMEFESDEDRNYYVHDDPAHQAVIKSMDGIVEKVQVLDFTPGGF